MHGFVPGGDATVPYPAKVGYPGLSQLALVAVECSPNLCESGSDATSDFVNRFVVLGLLKFIKVSPDFINMRKHWIHMLLAKLTERGLKLLRLNF